MVQVPDGYDLENDIDSWKERLQNSGSAQMSEAE